jgi:hypothetical protein
MKFLTGFFISQKNNDLEQKIKVEIERLNCPSKECGKNYPTSQTRLTVTLRLRAGGRS